jgi:hypothetical protein
VLYLFETTLRSFDVGFIYGVRVLVGRSIILYVYNEDIKKMLKDDKSNCGGVVIVEASIVKHELFDQG